MSFCTTSRKSELDSAHFDAGTWIVDLGEVIHIASDVV
jgi:hypothetical protein